MQQTISATFESADAADRALTRLRRICANVQAEICRERRGESPADAPAAFSAYFPWRMNMSPQESGTLAPDYGSRALYTSDLMGLPIYHDGETRMLIRLDADQAEAVRTLLVNMGGYGIRLC